MDQGRNILSGESGIRTRGPRFQGHIISNDAHSATLPSLRYTQAAQQQHYNRIGRRRKFSRFVQESQWFSYLPCLRSHILEHLC